MSCLPPRNHNNIQFATDFTARAIAVPACPRCKAAIYPSPNVMRYKSALQRALGAVRRAQRRAEEGAQLIAADLEAARANVALLKGAASSKVPQSLSGLLAALEGTLAFEKRVRNQSDALRRKWGGGSRDGGDTKRPSNKEIHLQLSLALCSRIAALAMVLRAMERPPRRLSARIVPIALNEGMRAFAELPPTASREALELCIRETFLKVLRAEMPQRFYLSIPSPDAPLSELSLAVASVRAPMLSAEEKASIMKALTANGVSPRGAFRECSCGYIYAIGECGQPMVIGRCPECGTRIGGRDHQDVVGVRHTNVIDGTLYRRRM